MCRSDKLINFIGKTNDFYLINIPKHSGERSGQAVVVVGNNQWIITVNSINNVFIIELLTRDTAGIKFQTIASVIHSRRTADTESDRLPVKTGSIIFTDRNDNIMWLSAS